MSTTIKVRFNNAYLARAMGLGVSASNAESAKAAACAVCRKLGLAPELLEQSAIEQNITTYTHPTTATKPTTQDATK